MFGTLSGFRKHSNTKPIEYINQQVDTDGNLSSAGQAVITNVDETATTSQLLRKYSRSTLDVCATAVAQLKAAGLSQSNVNSFVSSMEEVFLEIHSQAKDAALDRVLKVLHINNAFLFQTI